MPAVAPDLKLAINQDRRRYRRVEVVLAGRYMLPDRREFPCRTVDVSPGGARIACTIKGTPGDRVVAYIDQIGRIEGAIMRLFDDGFAFTIEAGVRKREKLAAQLTWIANRSVLGLPEDRRHDRYTPPDPNTEILRNDGTRHSGVIVDISRSGAAVKCSAPVDIGEPVTVGEHQGIVVRLFDNGFAVEFSQMLESANTEPFRADLSA